MRKLLISYSQDINHVGVACGLLCAINHLGHVYLVRGSEVIEL